MPVNFVAGQGTPPSSCTNSSGVSAQFASDSTLSALKVAVDLLPLHHRQDLQHRVVLRPQQPHRSLHHRHLREQLPSITGLEMISGTLLAGVLCTLFNL